MKKKMRKLAVEVGAGVVTAAALAGAAAYLLSNTKMAKKGKAKARAWTLKAKREIVRNVRAARRMSQADYARLVDRAVKRASALEHANAAEIMQAAREMKGEWKRIRRHAEMTAKGARRPARRTAKKRRG